jgi:ribosomal protein L35AE/L33A
MNANPHLTTDEEAAMLKLLDIVKADDPDTGLKAGTEGTIVDVHGNHEAYTVEFSDEDGNTIEEALFKDYLPAQLQKVETALQP